MKWFERLANPHGCKMLFQKTGLNQRFAKRFLLFQHFHAMQATR